MSTIDDITREFLAHFS